MALGDAGRPGSARSLQGSLSSQAPWRSGMRIDHFIYERDKLSEKEREGEREEEADGEGERERDRETKRQRWQE